MENTYTCLNIQGHTISTKWKYFIFTLFYYFFKVINWCKIFIPNTFAENWDSSKVDVILFFGLFYLYTKNAVDCFATKCMIFVFYLCYWNSFRQSCSLYHKEYFNRSHSVWERGIERDRGRETVRQFICYGSMNH